MGDEGADPREAGRARAGPYGEAVRVGDGLARAELEVRLHHLLDRHAQIVACGSTLANLLVISKLSLFVITQERRRKNDSAKA